MTRTDAFLFAVKKVLDQQRNFIDSCDVKSIQVTVSLNRDGQANVKISHITEDTVMGCYEGTKRHDRFLFSTK